MGSKHELQSFWTSLITENGISPHVESLMKIIDTEERSLALMSRVFFLWCMGIKYQREDLEYIINMIRTILNKSSGTKATCIKCTEIKALLEKNDFVKSPESLNNCTNISSKRKNQSNSPPQLLKKLCSRDKENIDISPEKFPAIEILAPETQPFLQMKDIVNKEFIIPETVQVDDGLYGNTDFFNTSQDLNEKSPISKKFNTSPILGKICKPSNSPASNQSKTLSRFSEPATSKPHISSPSTIKGKSPSKIVASPDSVNSSPSLLGCNIINQIPIFAHPTSPVKKGKMISINSKEGQSLTPSKSKFAPGVQSEVANSSFHVSHSLRSTPSRNPLKKCKSDMGNVLSNRSRLSRLKTLTSLKDEKSKLEVSLDLKGKRKSYRQTKITQDSFLKPTNVVRSQGGKCDIVDINDDDDEKAMEEAIEASLHSKEIEDLLRKKHQEIDKEIHKKEKKVNINPAENSVRKSPRNKCQKSLNFGSPSKGNNSKVSEEEVLADLEKDHVVKNKEEDGDAKVRKTKKNIFQDSFDVLPTKNDEPNYAYKGDVVRKNSEKQKLDGWNCHECRDYYESKDLTEEQRKTLQNKCSRHRSKYRPVTNTPEGFWKVGWSDEEET